MNKIITILLFVFSFLGQSQQITIQKDSPNERLDFEILKTKDPTTGEVPTGIRLRELEFMRSQEYDLIKPFALGEITTAWYNRGPHNVGGRTRALAVDSRNENIVLAGGVSGGMWRSTDGGVSWTKTTGSSELQSVSCIAQDQNSPDIWYYGTGELAGNSASGNGATYFGNGIYKSTDNGLSWSLLSSTASNTPSTFDNRFDFINEIAVDPTNGDVYAATYDGIFLSTNGGTSFGIELGGANSTYWTDVVISSAGTIYAVLDGLGVYKTDDAITWVDITPSMSAAQYERKELAISGNGNSLYLLGEGGTHVSGHELWHFNESTDTWIDRSDQIPRLGGVTGNFDSQGGYDLLIKVSPTDEDFVIIGGTSLFRSTDGFTTTTNTSWIGGYSPSNINSYGQYTNHHADQHSFVFLSGNAALSGNDGGVQYTSDITATNANAEQISWTPLNNGYLTTQVYAVSAGPGDQVMAGFQDNSTWLSISTDADATWRDQFSGDGAYNAFNSDGTVRFVSAQSGQVYRIGYSNANDQTPNSYTNVQPSGYSNPLFIAPLYLDPNDDEILYMGGTTTLYVNTQASTSTTSTSWKSIALASGKISEFGITSTAGTVYVGTSTGRVFKVTNAHGTESYSEITSASFPSGYVSGIGVNPENDDELLISFSNYGVKSVWHSSDAGSTWTDISGSLEENADGSGDGPSVRTVAILGDGVKYFAGTSTGLYSTSSLSGTSTVWTQEDGTGIGEVVVEHMVGKSDGTMVVGTHGNGVFTATYDIVVPPVDELEVTAVNVPSDGALSSSESISALITNNGTDDQNAYSLTLNVDGTNVVTDNISSTIMAGDSYTHNFSTSVDLSIYGDYSVNVTLTLAGDEDVSNNSLTETVSNTDHTTRPDYGTLMSFYGNNGGSGWTNSTNWGTSADFSTWHGLTVDGDCRVIKLELPNNNVTGAIPEDINGLSVLQEIDLSENLLTEATTEEMAIATLTKIDLSGNDLAYGLPSSLALLPSLTHLYADDNKLTILWDYSSLSLTDFSIENNELDFSDLVGNLPTATNLTVSPQANLDDAETVLLNEGDNYTLTISGDAISNEYQWYFDDEIFDGETNSTLEIIGANAEIDAFYHATVTNSAVPGLMLTRNSVEIVTNLRPTTILLSSNSIDENQPLGTTVGVINAVDPENDNMTFVISGTDGASFEYEVVDDVYNLVSDEVFDFETKASYEITITATDENGASLDKDFTITIEDQSLSVVLSNSSVAENQSTGTLVGDLSVESDDLTGPFTYSVTGTDASAFKIGGASNDELQTNTVFNYENDNSYEITITATDGTEIVSTDFTISIDDANDVIGVVELSNATIAENQETGTVIGAVTTNDEDVSDTYTYTITGADADLFDVVDDNLVALQSFDFETSASYSINIRVTDSGGASDDDDFTITITDEPEAPIDIVLTETSFDENSGNEYFVAVVLVTDEDAAEFHTVELTGADAESFKVLSFTDIYTNEPIDFETKDSYSFTVVVTDKDGLTYEEDVTVTVNDVDEPLTGVLLSGSLVDENQASGTLVGVISPDGDALGSYTYGLSGADAASFQLTGDDGNELQTAETFNFESKSIYEVTVSITEIGMTTESQDFTIVVRDVNDAPTALNLSEVSIEENLQSGTLIGEISTEDEDSADSFDYVLSGADAQSFKLEGNQLLSNEIFDFETKSSYQITITSTDQGGEEISETVTISIIDADDPLGLGDNAATVSIYPNPASEFVNVTLDESIEKAILKMADLNGRTTMEGLKYKRGVPLHLNVSNMSKGIYILTIETKQDKIFKRIVVE